MKYRLSFQSFRFVIFFFGLFLISFYCSIPDCSATAIPMVDSYGRPVDLKEELKKQPDFYIEKMKYYLRNGDLDLAGYLAKHIIGIRPDNVAARAIYSLSLSAQGNTKRAKETLALAESQEKDNPHVLYAKAMLLRLDKKFDAAVRICKQAIKKDRSHPYPWNILGRIYYDMEKYKKAMESFKKAVELTPDFLPGYSNIGATAFLLEDYNLSVDSFQKAIELNPQSYTAHYGLATAFEQLENYVFAVKELKNAIDIRPDDLVLLKKLGTLQLKAGYYKEALSTGKAIEKQGVPEANKILADAALHLGNSKGAITYLEKTSDDDPEIFYLRGFSYMADGQYDKAIEHMKNALNVNQSHFGAYTALKVLKMYTDKKVSPEKMGESKWDQSLIKFLYFIDGSIYAMQNEWPAAIKSWHSAEGIIGGFSTFGIESDTLKKTMTPDVLKYMNMGVLYYFKNLDKKALFEFEKALKIQKDAVLVNYWAAQIYLKKQDRVKAIEYYKKATEVAPNFFTALYATGELNFLTGNPERAIPYYKRALSVRKDAGILIKLGLIHEKSKDFDKAEKAYEEVVKLFPNLFFGYNQLAWLYAKRGVELDKALTLSKKANDLMPGNASILDTIGWIHFQKKNFDKALPKTLEANRINPNNPTILYHIGAIYHAMNKPPLAKKYLTSALDISKEFEEADHAKKLLDK